MPREGGVNVDERGVEEDKKRSTRSESECEQSCKKKKNTYEKKNGGKGLGKNNNPTDQKCAEC